uniref:Spartin n=2 Tax=Pan TaxID=9596 RepID=A0A2I3T3N8_PANTR
MEQEPQNGEPAEIKIIREAYKKAFLFVNKGLNTDELGQKEEAKNYYKQGIGHLLRGISISSKESEHTGPGWESARQMQQKMKETLQNVRTRLEILEKGLATSLQNDLQEVPKLYPEFPPKDMCEKLPEPQSFSSAPQHAEVNGNTSTPSAGAVAAPASLSLPSQSCPAEAPPAYTPQAAEGHYTVSYGTDSGEFSSVGEEFYRNHSQPPPLETLGLDPVPEEKPKELPEWSEKVAHNILSGASWVSWGLVKGAEFTGKAIQKGASKLRERIQPEEKPVEVSPAVTKGLYIAKQATGGAAKVSQFLVRPADQQHHIVLSGILRNAEF